MAKVLYNYFIPAVTVGPTTIVEMVTWIKQLPMCSTWVEEWIFPLPCKLLSIAKPHQTNTTDVGYSIVKNNRYKTALKWIRIGGQLLPCCGKPLNKHKQAYRHPHCLAIHLKTYLSWSAQNIYPVFIEMLLVILFINKFFGHTGIKNLNWKV